MRKTLLRTLLFILLSVGVFLVPYFVVVAGAILLFIVFQTPEVILVGVLLDIVYRGSVFDVSFVFTVLFIALFFSARLLRRYIIVYDT